MSLYDDEEVGLTDSGEAVGWSRVVSKAPTPTLSSAPPPILKNKSLKPVVIPSPLNQSSSKRSGSTLAPVINLQSNRGNKAPLPEASTPSSYYSLEKSSRGDKSLIPLTDPSWTPVNEYDPLWPNDYEKVISDIRDMKRQSQDDGAEQKKRRYTESSRDRARERFNQTNLSPSSSGFSRRRHSDDEEDDERRNNRRRRDRRSNPGPSSGGAAIAPPPSLTETSNPGGNTVDKGGGMAGLDVAAKIMAKYGYKQGQGLGREEQGISMALSVEKTSKRGGRIVQEKDCKPEESPGDEYGGGGGTPASVGGGKPSITDMMKNPSKVVLCKNMVGPGEVDEFLEPEVKEECNEKYGDVIKVVIYEFSNSSAEENAVRIFIEFKRVESAIKAVVDLNGRFFGGREVQANFYDCEKFNSNKLYD
eukprot:TRINITY_DN3843_c0_g1_i3.p1 TRINITY_DN3843_c0_g1~~TRINITY_DN3843_c0_g1_i3.p1  ORF type:complete len:418 (-),score=134.48 TRINITY_DN3843_c0_g1_i3:874-2127(-)